MSNALSAQGAICVCALYKFVSLADYEQLRPALLAECERLDVKGTLLLAAEGINGTISGSHAAIRELILFLEKDHRLTDIDYKYSSCSEHPFYRMKVKLKKEIVTLGVAGIDPNKKVGSYVPPEQWNALIDDPDVLLIDTRNRYEVEIGTFKGAVDPRTDSFREFPEFVQQNCDPSKHKKVAMFCTGGIRCEKASAYMLEQGFEEVYHLQGGILNYLEQVPSSATRWQGECFVFDNRVAVDHDLKEGVYDQCHACRRPLSEQDKLSEHYSRGVSCHRCINETSADQKQRFAERQKQIELAKRRDEQHIGAPPPSRQLKNTLE